MQARHAQPRRPSGWKAFAKALFHLLLCLLNPFLLLFRNFESSHHPIWDQMVLYRPVGAGEDVDEGRGPLWSPAVGERFPFLLMTPTAGNHNSLVYITWSNQ